MADEERDARRALRLGARVLDQQIFDLRVAVARRLQFLWNVNTVSANKISFDGIEGIHEEACNGTCADLNVTWSLLRQGAEDYYGGDPNNLQYQHFRNSGDAFGVDEDQ